MSGAKRRWVEVNKCQIQRSVANSLKLTVKRRGREKSPRGANLELAHPASLANIRDAHLGLPSL